MKVRLSVYAAVQRTDGFKSTISEGGKFEVVASVPGNWDRQTSYDAATNILNQHPDLVGFYANNDGMALGIVEAVKAAGLQGKVAVFGTDGISDAYASIKARRTDRHGRQLPGPDRRSGARGRAAPGCLGQKLPRVVATPQALITADNLSRYQGAGVDVRAVLMEDAKAAK